MAARHATAPDPAESKSHGCSSLTDDQWAMVLEHQGLIRFTIRRWYRGAGDDIDDLVQDGLFGLARAVQKYDPALGRFSTYAVTWIRQSIARGLGRLEGADYRAAVIHGKGEWQRPISLEYLRDPERPFTGTYVDHLEAPPLTTEPEPPDSHAAAAAELAWAHARTPFDAAVLEALEDGRGAVQATVDFGYTRGSSAKAVARMRDRIAATVAELEASAP